MKSSLKWPGGKGPLASWIVSLMSPHTHYVEPYFGAGSVLFAKDPEGVSEVVNDLNSELTNLWQVLQDESLFPKFVRIMQAIPVSETEWRWAGAARGPGDSAVDSYRLTEAISFFIRVRQSLAARGKCFTALSKTRTRRGMNEQASSWLTAVEGLPAVHARLKRVVILNRPALDVIRSEDGPQTLFYLDPPYLHETRQTTEEYRELEMDAFAHGELLTKLMNIEGRFMLSGYLSKMYEEAARANGWTRHEKQVANHASHARIKGREVECVWTNY